MLWSARYDEAAADLFALQDRISREIAGALAIRVSEQEQKRVTDIGAKAADPVRRRTAGCGAERRVGRIVRGQRDGRRHGEPKQHYTPGPQGKASDRRPKRIAPMWLEFPFMGPHGRGRHRSIPTQILA